MYFFSNVGCKLIYLVGQGKGSSMDRSNLKQGFVLRSSYKECTLKYYYWIFQQCTVILGTFSVSQRSKLDWRTFDAAMEMPSVLNVKSTHQQNHPISDGKNPGKYVDYFNNKLYKTCLRYINMNNVYSTKLSWVTLSVTALAYGWRLFSGIRWSNCETHHLSRLPWRWRRIYVRCHERIGKSLHLCLPSRRRWIYLIFNILHKFQMLVLLTQFLFFSRRACHNHG